MTVENVEYGCRDCLRGEILRTVVGSGVHGIAIEGTDDHDEMGIYIESPVRALGVQRYNDDYREDYIWRTQPEGGRSGPGDIDLTVYSLQKYLRLAIKGNPTALLPMFAPEESILLTTELGMELRENRDWFLSNEAVERFLGYMNNQHQRMMGHGRRSLTPNRPELVEKYGWDVKYGSHALRLAYQGREIAVDGTLTLPLKPETRLRVLAVKRGQIPRKEVSDEIIDIAADIHQRLKRGDTAVREHPKVVAIEQWSVHAHLSYWGLK